MTSQTVERRSLGRDRRRFGDRRSNVLPNMTEYSRRVTRQDRRGEVADRRIRSSFVQTPALISIKPVFVKPS